MIFSFINTIGSEWVWFEIYPLLTKDDQVYGALIRGKLANFTVNKQSGVKADAGTNEFYFLLRFNNNKWFIIRDVSYNTNLVKDKK